MEDFISCVCTWKCRSLSHSTTPALCFINRRPLKAVSAMVIMNTGGHLTPALHQLETWMSVTFKIHTSWISQPHRVHHLHWVSHFPPPPSYWRSLKRWTRLSFLIQLTPHRTSQPRHSKPPPCSTASKDCASNWCVPGPGFIVNVTPDCFKEKSGPNGLEASSIQFGIYQSKRIFHLLEACHSLIACLPLPATGTQER